MSKCPTCGNNFKSELGVKQHHAKVHGESLAGDLVECAGCGDEYRTPKWQNEKFERNFCSTECKSNGYNKQVEVVCEQCAVEFKKKRSLAEGVENHYCSNECKGKAYRDRLEVVCDNCGDKFTRRRSNVKPYTNHYCGDECRVKHMRGMADPKWNGGNTLHGILLRQMAGKRWRPAKRQYFEENKRECKLCGASESPNGSGLQLHHIIPIMAGGVHEEELMMPVCQPCHHRVDGYMRGELRHPIAELVKEFSD